MLTIKQIREAICCDDLAITSYPGRMNFQFCGLDVNIRDNNEIIVTVPEKKLTSQLLGSLDFIEFRRVNTHRFVFDCADDEQVYQILFFLQAEIWQQPMQLECGIGGFRGEQFKAHPKFLVRWGELHGNHCVYFTDPVTGNWFLRTSAVVSSVYHSNGWVLITTESGTKYSLTL